MQSDFLFLVIVGVVGASWYISEKRSQAMLQRWAGQNGYQLVKINRSWFGGPFWWRKGRDQSVFTITVCDRAGRYRSGHALCGDWFLGMWSDAVRVEWNAG